MTQRSYFKLVDGRLVHLGRGASDAHQRKMLAAMQSDQQASMLIAFHTVARNGERYAEDGYVRHWSR